MADPTREPPVATPTVSTAPRPSRFSKVPAHLWRARTSTVVLSVLFLAIGTLYLNIRPDPPGAPRTPETGNEQPVAPETPVPETTPPTTTAPTTTPRTTTSAPTETTGEPTTTGGPTETATPEESVETGSPSRSLPTGRPTGRTTAGPPN